MLLAQAMVEALHKDTACSSTEACTQSGGGHFRAAMPDTEREEEKKGMSSTVGVTTLAEKCSPQTMATLLGSCCTHVASWSTPANSANPGKRQRLLQLPADHLSGTIRSHSTSCHSSIGVPTTGQNTHHSSTGKKKTSANKKERGIAVLLPLKSSSNNKKLGAAILHTA